MAEIEMDLVSEEDTSVWQFKWLVEVLLHPRKIMNQIGNVKKGIWLLPMLVLMVSSLMLVLVSVPIARQSTPTMTMPEDFDNYPNEYKENYQDVMSVNVSLGNIIVAPLLGRFASIWIGWLLLGILLHLSLTLNGSRSSNQGALNIVAWGMVPLALRDVVQILYMLFTQQMVQGSGLSGFASQNADGFGGYLGIFLGFFDLYFLWQIVLTVYGAKVVSGLKVTKSWIAVLIAVIVFLALKAVPGYVVAQVSGIFTNGRF